MRVLVTLAARFDRCPDGRIYPQFPSLDYQFFQRYLEVFEEVQIAGRVRSVAWFPQGQKPADGPGVSFVEVPLFNGFFDLVRLYPHIVAALRHGLAACDAYLLRVPDFLGTIAWREIRRQRVPYALEIVGDPNEVLQAGGGVHHPLRPLIRFLAARYLKNQCAEAAAVAYVTKHFLQQNYPPGERTLATNYSTIDLPSSFYVAKPRQYSQPATKLIYIGTLAVLYKGQDVLLDAIAMLAGRGLSLHITFVGDGRCRGDLAVRTKALGLAKHTTFLGNIPSGAAVAAAIDAAELMVLPSRTEGLPKVIIEAMARGLPCIGSTAGGIPELLLPEDLVPPGDAKALADKIQEVVQDPDRLTHMSARNLAVAQEYRQEIIGARRRAFYRQVREQAEAWSRGARSR